MASHRIKFPIPEKYESLVDVENFSRRISSALMPEMAATWGPIWEANNEVIDYSAHGWQPDGSFVYLSVNPKARTIELYIDTEGLERLEPPGPSVNWWMTAIVITAIAVGLWQRSFWIGVVTLFATFSTWIGIEAFVHRRARKSRRIDTVAWDTNLTDALRLAAA